jgi:hypothetical protein
MKMTAGLLEQAEVISKLGHYSNLNLKNIQKNP